MPLLVLLNGIGDMPQVWQDQVTSLPPGYKAVAPWVRGTRPGRNETFEMDAAADDVLALLNQHGVEQMDVCGLGLGAMVALNTAIRSPENVEHLVLTACQLAPPASALRAQKLAIRLTPRARLARMGVDKDRALATLTELARTDLRDGLANVTAKTLVIVGARDSENRATADELVAGIPGARLEVVPGAGAKANVDAPGVFNDLLYGFLADQPPGSDQPSGSDQRPASD